MCFYSGETIVKSINWIPISIKFIQVLLSEGIGVLNDWNGQNTTLIFSEKKTISYPTKYLLYYYIHPTSWNCCKYFSIKIQTEYISFFRTVWYGKVLFFKFYDFLDYILTRSHQFWHVHYHPFFLLRRLLLLLLLTTRRLQKKPVEISINLHWVKHINAPLHPKSGFTVKKSTSALPFDK